MKLVDLKTDYQVAKAHVRLTITIGDAQIGSSIVSLDGKELGRGEIDGLDVGAGPKVKGKLLFIKSVVSDVNDSTNHTSITYELSGGALDQAFRSASIVDIAGDSVIYRASFNLA